jgi:hypothetical protein
LRHFFACSRRPVILNGGSAGQGAARNPSNCDCASITRERLTMCFRCAVSRWRLMPAASGVIGMPSPMNNNGFCAAAFRLGAVPDSQWGEGPIGRTQGAPVQPRRRVRPVAPVNLRSAYMLLPDQCRPSPPDAPCDRLAERAAAVVAGACGRFGYWQE